ncbi:MAG: DUF4229 domain-containing protein [Propionibacteriales bacterium]|nr:DUF4229 domain-containing protein [Propionibacteriales bacterium]
MKYFLIYTAARFALFLACWSVLIGIGALVSDDNGTIMVWSLVGAAVVSSLLSLKVLNGPRERFAQSVEERAARAKAKFEEMKTAEDVD